MSSFLLNSFWAGPVSLFGEAVWYIDADRHDGNSSVENLGTGGSITGTQSGVLYLAGDTDPYFYITGSHGMPATGNDVDLNSLEICVRVRLPDWTPAAITPLVAKFAESSGSDSNRQYYFRLNTDGTLGLLLRTAGTNNSYSSTVATGLTDGATYWVRVTRDQASGTVKFYTAADSATEPASWTQLGSNVAGTTSNLTSSAQSLFIGSLDDTTTHATGARFYNVILRNAASSGTLVAQMNAAAANADARSSWNDSVGNTWTQDSGARHTVLVDRSMWAFDGVDDYIEWADDAALDLSSGQDCTWIVVLRGHDHSGTNSMVLSKMTATPTGANLYFENSAGLGRFNFAPGADDVANGPAGSNVKSGFTILAGTVDLAAGDQTYCWVGGTFGSVNAVSDSSIANTAVMRMGSTSAGGTFATIEVVAAARWNRVLTDGELDALLAYFQTR